MSRNLEIALAGLGGVTSKRMFGCDCWFRDGVMFALSWKTGRVGVKLPDERTYAELKALGAEPSSPGGKMKMGAWLLVPEAWNDDAGALRTWVARAHAAAKKVSDDAAPRSRAPKRDPRRRT